MRNYGAELVEYRKGDRTTRQDVLAALLDGNDLETGKSLTESQVIDEIASMPIGYFTAPCLISSAIYLLLKNSHVITLAREELNSVIDNGEFEVEHLSELKYLKAIVRESLRLSFAAPGFNIEPIPRQGKSLVLLGGGKYQRSTVFDEPFAFRPERMMGEAFDKLPSGVKNWFGNGKRQCIGKHWAWQFNMVVLAKLIREVNFEEWDPAYALEQDGWFNLRPVNFSVKVK